MIRRTGAAFRGVKLSTGDVFNMTDASQGVPGGWTQGQTLIDIVPLSFRSNVGIWNATSVSIAAQLLLFYIANTLPPMYGKLGRIMCGLTTTGPQTPDVNSGTLFSNPLSQFPLPRDSTLLAPLWDPAIDPLPPINPVPVFLPSTTPAMQMLNVSAQVVLPAPLPIPAGANLFAGIWIQSSLLASVSPVTPVPTVTPSVFNAQYSVAFEPSDMGQGPLPNN